MSQKYVEEKLKELSDLLYPGAAFLVLNNDKVVVTSLQNGGKKIYSIHSRNSEYEPSIVEREKKNGSSWAKNISCIEAIEITDDDNVKLTKIYHSD